MMNISFLSPVERADVGGRARSPLQVFLETQFKCLADGGDDVLRQPTSAFEDIASPTVDSVLGDVGDEIERVLESSKQYNNNNGPFIIKRGFPPAPRESERERVNYHLDVVVVVQSNTYGVAAGSERNIGHVVTGDDATAFQRADAQAAAADGQGDVAAGVLHVRGVSQNPLDPPIHLRQIAMQNH